LSCWKFEVVVNNKGIWFKTWDTDWPLTPLNHLYTPLGMCCLLIPYREEIMRGAEGLKSEKGVQHMRQDAHEQPNMQERKGPL
jgi:hypothetical protein